MVESVFDKRSSCLKIHVKGRFDYTCHKMFKESYSVKEKVLSYDVDFKKVDYLDSSALGMLLLLRDHAGGDQGSVRLVNAKGPVVDILKIANFHRLFDIVE